MSPDDLSHASAPQLLAWFSARSASPSETFATQDARRRLWEPHLKAYITLATDAPSRAREMDHEDRGALAGLTLGVKDLYDVQGLPTTGGSRAYGTEPAHSDSFVVARLRAEGAVITGKLNTQELALGVLTPPTRNPWSLDRIPGGSSGGSAAALAAGMVTLALGSDTAGSIRIPAALCGVCGLKPTAGLVSRTGVMPLSLTLDHTGPMARDVPSLDLLFRAMVAYDPNDPQSIPLAPPPLPETRRLGVPWAWFEESQLPAVRESFATALERAASLGYEVVRVDLPPLTEFTRLQLAIRAPETFHIHRAAIWDRPELFGAGVVERIARGRASLGVDYVAALEERHLFTLRLERDLAGQGIDGLLLPTTPVTAPPVGAQEVVLGNGERVDVREALISLTGPFNLTGWPAVSVPMGWDSDGLPTGLQIVGRRFEDLRLLARAAEILSGLPSRPWPPVPSA